MKSVLMSASCLVVAFALTGCGSRYLAPGRGAELGSLAPAAERAETPGTSQAGSDTRLAEAMRRRPAAQFPAAVAVIRVQSSGYRSHTAESYGHGKFSVVTNRDVETDDHMERLMKLPMVSTIGSVNRLVLPERLDSDLDLRRAAAAIQADLTLLYTFDTTLRMEDSSSPLDVVTLGFLPHKSANVHSTASAVLLDTRTGYVYALAEGTGSNNQLANTWTTRSAVDQSRLKAEKKAFDQLVDQLEKVWGGVVDQYALKSVVD